MHYERFSPKQRLAMTWWRDPRCQGLDGILCDGSVRSGKTVSMAVGFLLWSMSRFEDQRFALCGKTIESLRRNVAGLLPRWMEGLAVIQEKRSENKLTVTMGNRHNEYYLFGGKDESSYQLIQGLTLAGVLFDEVALMPRSFVEQALARCSVAGSKFWFNCNPEGPEHWFYKGWVQKAEERKLLHLHFTMEDNPSLDPEIRVRYQRLYTGVFYRRYVRGEWVAAEGRIYDMFDPDRHVALRETAGPCWVSVDYGTQNPTVFLLWRQDGAGHWHCAREYYWSGRKEGRQKTDGEYARDLEGFLEGERPRAVIVDPSAASFIALLRQRGYAVQGADNQVLTGIRQVGELLQQEKLSISPDCVHTISEFQAYVWDSSAGGQDRPVKEHDHCMDAIRYFAATVLGRGEVRAGRRPRGL